MGNTTGLGVTFDAFDMKAMVMDILLPRITRLWRGGCLLPVLGALGVTFLFPGEVKAVGGDAQDRDGGGYPGESHWLPSIFLVSAKLAIRAAIATTIPQNACPWNRPTATAATLIFSSQSAIRLSTCVLPNKRPVFTLFPPPKNVNATASPGVPRICRISASGLPAQPNQEEL